MPIEVDFECRFQKTKNRVFLFQHSILFLHHVSGGKGLHGVSEGGGVI